MATLGARDFSSAVSGFCQVFIFSLLRRSWLRPTAENVSAFGKHRKFPPHARKPLVPRVIYGHLMGQDIGTGLLSLLAEFYLNLLHSWATETIVFCPI